MIRLYVIPGFGETTSDQGYRQIITFAKKKGYQVVEVNPVWERNTITRWLNDFNSVLESDAGTEAIVIGFSFGAYIAALSAVHHNFGKVIFCSLSPYFKDDIDKLPAMATKLLGKRRMKDFSNHVFPDLAKSPAVFLVGDKDIPLVIRRTKKSYQQWSGNKKLQILSGVSHDISHPLYISTIEVNL